MDIQLAFIETLQQTINAGEFIKISFGDYKGEDATLRNVYVKPALIKRVLMLSFTYRYQTRDITKNFNTDEGIAHMHKLLAENRFRAATLFTSNANVRCQYGKRGRWLISREKPTAAKVPSLTHDIAKERKLQHGSKRYLQELRLTDEQGKVYKNAQDKWKQINHYIEILSNMLQNLPATATLQVVDMGAGKGYLTFALYDYLKNILKRDVTVTGVEYRKDLVDFCNQVAKRADFNDLSFVEGSIESYEPTHALNVLIALHACDTATDDAIAKGIKNDADLIVVAPCCHKQIRREMEKSKSKNELDFMLKHGIFLERQAEMLTDGLRALIMEYYGYQTKVFQFVSDAHTPKNVLVVGVKKGVDAARKAEIKATIETSKSYFGIAYHQLERLLELG
ncbi:class I SAM-dependent methyltransferase [Sphingobacterium griseoflavum]|uniref:Methyltransferase n=1 Tax=Sphingobacterium griseoflavum TaxID=1474952 RepID=A0ABQ3HZT8_9SPHI|nr:SAM-dependent methyltransferase [Sphingobacterium griseoflavum]GHE48562.1 methyltransferase [Sphingobacterium griseoflavum]